MKILLVDDEIDVLMGLKSIIDWQSLGIETCLTTSSSVEALEIIKNEIPDLVIIDINMPVHTGIDIIKITRENNFHGHFFILSGVSDFYYAQEAIRYGATMYLTKPVDEDELYLGLEKSIKEIKKSREQSNFYDNYFDTAKYEILKNIIIGDIPENQNLLKTYETYQVLLFHDHINNQNNKDTDFDFATMFEIFYNEDIFFETLKINNQKFALLIGEKTIKRFAYLVNYYDKNIEKKSPLDSIFLIYGNVVKKIDDIHISYEEVLTLLDYRFFTDKNKHTLGFELIEEKKKTLTNKKIENQFFYSHKLVENIKANGKNTMNELLKDLKEIFLHNNYDEKFIKNFMIDIFISVRESLKAEGFEIPVESNFSITNTINNIMFIHELFYYLNKQFTVLINSISTNKEVDIIEIILNYIDNNFNKDLTLDNIAKVYNYNTAYLGKLFTKKVGTNFNSYVEKIRIEEAKKLLLLEDLKIYEVSEKCGYKNVDYFNRKFKNYTGLSPSKYKGN